MLSKISLAISAVLAILVGYLLFKSPSTAAVPAANLPTTTNQDGVSSIKPVIIAYFDGDTIMAKYEFFQDKKKVLESSATSAESQLRNEAMQAQKEIEELYAYAQTNELTEENKAEVQARIYELQSKMQSSEERASNNLLDKQNTANLEVMARIEAFAKEYAQQNGIDYVLSYQRAAQLIFYANTSYDITPQILSGLNARYREEKGK
jgi:outer membrane protein